MSTLGTMRIIHKRCSNFLEVVCSVSLNIKMNKGGPKSAYSHFTMCLLQSLPKKSVFDILNKI